MARTLMSPASLTWDTRWLEQQQKLLSLFKQKQSDVMAAIKNNAKRRCRKTVVRETGGGNKRTQGKKRKNIRSDCLWKGVYWLLYPAGLIAELIIVILGGPRFQRGNAVFLTQFVECLNGTKGCFGANKML